MKIIRLALISVLLFNVGCADIRVKNTSSDDSPQGKNAKTPISVVFKKRTGPGSYTVLNLEGKPATEFNYDDLNAFFEKNYVYPGKPYKLTPAEHAILTGEDIWEKICFGVAGLMILGIVSKQWRPF